MTTSIFALIRSEPDKPLRVFLQDGCNDLANVHGNWWLANQEMEAALKFKEYDYTFVGGTGGHSGKHGALDCSPGTTYVLS